MKVCPYPSHLSPAPPIYGLYTQTHECELLLWIASKTNGDIVEIGCSNGQLTKSFAERFPDRKIFAIDWTSNGRLQGPQVLETPHAVAELANGFPNVVTYDGDSNLFPYPETIGFIFIDADHSYAGVKSDSEKAFLYARSHDVILSWHDYSKDFWPGVVQYLDELSERGLNAVNFEGTTVVVADFRTLNL